MEPDMKKKDDALAGAVAELRAASTPRAKLLARARADGQRAERRRRDGEQRELDALRSRFAAVAPAADAWFAQWVRQGRLDLVVGARADSRCTRIALPRFHIKDGGAVWEHEDPTASDGQHRWYDFALGARTHALFGGLTGITFYGGIGGDLGTVRGLAELARKQMKYPTGCHWAGMEQDVLRVGLRVAELLRDDALEPILVERLRREARWVGESLERKSADLIFSAEKPIASDGSAR